MPILFAGDEYREAKACMSSILSSDSPVIIGNMTTDGDSNAFKGARDAQLECTGKPMERMADVIHLTKCMRNKITERTEISARQARKRFISPCFGRVQVHR